MVPEVDKKDTHELLSNLRETIESARQEIKHWHLPKEQTSNDAEAAALRQLANRSTQQARQWAGRMLGELGIPHPYPNSSNPTNQVVDQTTVPQTVGLDLPADFTVVQRIKHTRAVLSAVKAQLEEVANNCTPGSFFLVALRLVQQHALQASMWLGELLHEFFEYTQKQEAEVSKNEVTPTTSTTEDLSNLAPVIEATSTDSGAPTTEAVAPGNDAAPTPTTSPSEAATNSGLGAESSPAAISPIAEDVNFTTSNTENDAVVNPSFTSTASVDSTNSTELLPNTPEPTESALAPNGNGIATETAGEKKSTRVARK